MLERQESGRVTAEEAGRRIKVTDEAVAAAARVFYGDAYGSVGDEGNRLLHEGAREALEGAVPHLQVQAGNDEAGYTPGGLPPDTYANLGRIHGREVQVDRETLRSALEQALGLSKGVLATTHRNHGFDSGCPVCRGKSGEIADSIVDDLLALLSPEETPGMRLSRLSIEANARNNGTRCTCPTEADVTVDMRNETGQHLAKCPLSTSGEVKP